MALFLAFLILGAGLVFLFWGFRVERNAFRIQTFQTQLRKSMARPYRILHLSDIHFSGPREPLSLFFDRLAEEIYDFVFLTGDIFDHAEGTPHAVRELKKLKSRHGMFGVWGNHDYYNYRFVDILVLGAGIYPKQKNPIELLERAMEEAGVRLLKNETVQVSAGEDIFLIHGLDDPTTAHCNVPQIIQNAHSGKINLLLTHTIDVFQDLPHALVDVSFSGHSHGGQVRMPGIGAMITHTQFGREYAAGLKSLKGAACCISQGLGTSRYLPLRFLCPPAAVVLEITSFPDRS